MSERGESAMSDESKDLDIVRDRTYDQAYQAAEKARAFELWSTTCNQNCAQVERMLRMEARERAVEVDGVLMVDPVPATSTIQRWAKAEDWRGQAYKLLAEVLGETKTDWAVRLRQAVNQAIDDIVAIQLGAYDHNPMAGALHLKSSELALKAIGRLAGGAGELTINPAELVKREGPEKAVSPQLQSARNLARIRQQKEGTGL